MTYQVIARKWRPQKFDDVVGQHAVTRTLRNALANKRLAQAFVFAGPRGVGKTTTARILARALNCVNGPTADPCGVCDACVEIAEGRDMDVLEIDAATHTGVDNVREVIISGLGILPVRDRKKVFIIDEVHQLSSSSFNALLKSIEEPPEHVVFMMATTELDKIPETILSRSQVYEFRTISGKAIADQLRRIVDADGIDVIPRSAMLLPPSHRSCCRTALPRDLLHRAETVERRFGQRRRLRRKVDQRPGHQEHHDHVEDGGQAECEREALDLSDRQDVEHHRGQQRDRVARQNGLAGAGPTAGTAERNERPSRISSLMRSKNTTNESAVVPMPMIRPAMPARSSV